MKTTGWQLKEALGAWELRKKSAEKLFPESLHTFKGETKDRPESIVGDFLKAEQAIARLQVAQMRYNLTVKVKVLDETMTLAEAIKLVGGAGRVEKMWGSVNPDRTRSYMPEYGLTRDPNQERAEQVISVKEGTKLAEQARKRASGFRAAINGGNAQEVDIENLDPNLFE